MRVKKVLLVLLLVVLHYSNCDAQLLRFIEKAEQIEISVGPSLATIRNERFDVKMYDIKIGRTARLTFDYRFNKSFYLNAGFHYERKGYRRQSSHVGYYDPSIDSTNCKCTLSYGDAETTLNLDYLEFSLAPKFKIKNIAYVSIGFYVGYLIKDMVIDEYSWKNPPSKYSPMALGRVQRWDGGIILSAGKTIKIKDRETLDVSLNDTYGLVNRSFDSSSISMTNSLSLQIGYILRTRPKQ